MQPIFLRERNGDHLHFWVGPLGIHAWPWSIRLDWCWKWWRPA